MLPLSQRGQTPLHASHKLLNKGLQLERLYTTKPSQVQTQVASEKYNVSEHAEQALKSIEELNTTFAQHKEAMKDGAPLHNALMNRIGTYISARSKFQNWAIDSGIFTVKDLETWRHQANGNYLIGKNYYSFIKGRTTEELTELARGRITEDNIKKYQQGLVQTIRLHGIPSYENTHKFEIDALFLKHLVAQLILEDQKSSVQNGPFSYFWTRSFPPSRSSSKTRPENEVKTDLLPSSGPGRSRSTSKSNIETLEEQHASTAPIPVPSSNRSSSSSFVNTIDKDETPRPGNGQKLPLLASRPSSQTETTVTEMISSLFPF